MMKCQALFSGKNKKIILECHQPVCEFSILWVMFVFYGYEFFQIIGMNLIFVDFINV